MGAGWTTGGVRARGLLRRRLGLAGARRLAACVSTAEAAAVLRRGPYGHDVRRGHDLARAEHAVGAALLWHLRVLAGWQPRDGGEVIRLLAGWFEIANTVGLARSLAGAAPVSATAGVYRLGALATAWPRLSAAGSPPELRAVLAASPWGDPGGVAPRAIAVGMQAGWAARVAAAVPDAAPWTGGGAALLLARERFLVGRELPGSVADRLCSVLGAGAVDAGSWPVFRAGLHADARWALREVAEPVELWRAEAAWWNRVERDALVLARRPRFGVGALVGCVALLAVDAWRVRAAMQVAARGGRELEAFDAVC